MVDGFGEQGARHKYQLQPARVYLRLSTDTGPAGPALDPCPSCTLCCALFDTKIASYILYTTTLTYKSAGKSHDDPSISYLQI